MFPKTYSQQGHNKIITLHLSFCMLRYEFDVFNITTCILCEVRVSNSSNFQTYTCPDLAQKHVKSGTDC